MATLTIKDMPPLDGDYDLNISSFTNRELHTIKEISGVRAGELKEAMEAADNDLVVAFAVIALRRAGKQVDAGQIWDADIGAITVNLEDAVEEPRPPISASPHGNENSSDAAGSPNGSSTPSGEPSMPTGAPHLNDQSPTGLPGSETSAVSVPEMSAS